MQQNPALSGTAFQNSTVLLLSWKRPVISWEQRATPCQIYTAHKPSAPLCEFVPAACGSRPHGVNQWIPRETFQRSQPFGWTGSHTVQSQLSVSAGSVKLHIGTSGGRLTLLMQYLQRSFVTVQHLLLTQLLVQYNIDGLQPVSRCCQQPVGHGLPGQLQLLHQPARRSWHTAEPPSLCITHGKWWSFPSYLFHSFLYNL